MIRRPGTRALRSTAASVLLAVLAFAIAYAWGSSGHKIINRTAVRHLPPAMASFRADSAFYEAHASDADARRNYADTAMWAEAPRHFVDLWPTYDLRHGPHAFDSVVAIYGWETVKANGTNPWITATLTDTLTAQLRRGALTAAKQTMADLGHYIGDAHQPLHATMNYDGQYTGNGGIHSRYETSMIGKHLADLVVPPDTARYIDDPREFAFDYLFWANAHVDSILLADNLARSVSGGAYDTAYYRVLWQVTGGFTKQAFRDASVAVASIWYTAWVNAGLGSGVADALAAFPGEFRISQNYPNPFNPSTTFMIEADVAARATLTVYDLLGRAVATPLDGEVTPGTHRVTWNAAGAPSGVYLYVLTAGAERRSGRMLLLR